MKNNCGIYKIQNTVNKKLYIGSSEKITKRWTDHKSLLNSNQHHSKHLQAAWNKYGKDNFIFEVLEICKVDELLKREQYYLNNLLKADEYISDKNLFFIENGYNIKPFAENNKGFKMPKDSVYRMLKTRNISVYAINTDGKIIKEFLTTQEAAKYFGFSIGMVQTSIKNKKTTKYSEIGFCYVKNYFENYKPKKVEAWMKNTKGVLKNPNTKKVYVYDLKGNFVEEVNSQLECCNKYNLDPCNIIRSLNEKIRIDRMFNRKRKFLFRRTKNDKDILLLRQHHLNNDIV